MKLALSVLLISGLSTAGLLALWSATSPRSWFLRTAVFIGCVSVLLLIPAYEPLVAMVIQGVVVVVGFQFWRYLQGSRPIRPQISFSLATLMQLVVLVAIVTAISVRLPALNLRAWQSVILIGTVAGLATLLSCWVVHGRMVRWWLRLFATIVLAATAAFVLACVDWFFATTANLQGWPPLDDASISFGWNGGYSEYDLILVWLPIILATVIILVVIQLLLQSLIAKESVSGAPIIRGPRKWNFASAALLSLTFILVLPSAIIYYVLMTPLPIPEQHTGEPNGWADLCAASEFAANRSFDQSIMDYETATLKKLTFAVARMDKAYRLVTAGLAKPVWPQLDYEADFEVDSIQGQRNMARALAARGHLAESQERIEDAANTYFDVIRFGFAIRRCRLLVDDLVGSACSNAGARHLFGLRGRFPAKQAKRFVRELGDLERNCESAAVVVLRDRIWVQHQGWHSHLCQFLAETTENETWSRDAFVEARRRDSAVMRLLLVELALHWWNVEHKEFPDTLGELVPNYLPEIPLDPYSLEERPLTYRPTEWAYVLYSVGQNGVDDSGSKPPREEYGSLDLSKGDLRLDALFADPELETVEGEEPDAWPVDDKSLIAE